MVNRTFEDQSNELIMDYDELIEDAIRQSVKKSGQSDELANMLVNWFQEVLNGNESLDSVEATRRRSEILYDATSRNGSRNEEAL